METIEQLIQAVEEEAAARIGIMKKDHEQGMADCRMGIYDKWYRNNHRDGGKAYDAGWQKQNLITQVGKPTFLEG